MDHQPYLSRLARYRGQFVLGNNRFGLTAVTDRDDQSNRHGVERLTETPTAPPAAAAVLAALMVQTMTTPANQSLTRPMTETAAVVVVQRDGQHVQHECRRRWIIERNGPAPLPAASLLRLLSPLGVSVHAAGRGASKLRRGVGGGRRSVGGGAVVGRGVFGGEMMTGMSTRSQLDYLGFLPPIRH
jgi:hypothetical protein